jgi:hypothetical protein
MSVRVLIAAGALLALPLAAHAAEKPKGKNSDYSTKKICKVVSQTGSRLGGVKICRTRAEEEDMKAQRRQTMDRLQSGGNPPCRIEAMGGGCGG